MKVAIVHDWLVTYGGAESFVELLLKIYPDADIFTLVYDKRKIGNHFLNNTIFTSPLQKLPFATKLYTKLLKFMPKAFESFDFSNYDLVICSSSSCAKGVITPPDVPHIAYVHTPMRYAWDLFFDYRKRSGRITRFFMDKWMSEIRAWDYISSQRIDKIIANSKYISRRIKKFWNLDAEVIYSPVNLKRFTPIKNPSLDYYVAFSRLVPYKRIDIALDACKALGKNLVVIGSGSEEKRLKKRAAGAKNITFTGRISDEKLCAYLQNCKALIFCAEEDFGLVPLEAQACGRPVIAYGKGGACETVEDGETGVFFSEQTASSAQAAIERFEALDKKGAFKSETIAQHAASFSEERFIREFKAAVESAQKTLKQQTVHQ
ncbi:glycosyltransferase [Treponema socranskii subsp. buccale]|uniref:glycosyltransferase n=1 Tax=Treponema socranskii TaxID=53419 RepID=UPI0020A2B981|nr:glycosyltransferase [Treponema socranskii]UTD02579.1 glycosyltransferase [Treponema socranskii subsp. buccale]